MCEYRPYIRTILLSIVAAIVIVAIMSYADRKHEWTAVDRKLPAEELDTRFNAGLPGEIGRVTGSVSSFLLR